jgi:hypothetical protein
MSVSSRCHGVDRSVQRPGQLSRICWENSLDRRPFCASLLASGEDILGLCRRLHLNESAMAWLITRVVGVEHADALRPVRRELPTPEQSPAA